MLTKTQLTKLVDEVKADLTALGIEVPSGIKYEVSKRLTRGLGNYSETYQRNYSAGYAQRKYIITKVAIKVSVDVPLDKAHNVVMHEMIHAVNYHEYHQNGDRGVKPRHGKPFVKLADLVNRTYSDKYKIARIADTETAIATREAQTERRNASYPRMGFANYVIMPMPTLTENNDGKVK